ncbi:hypothetical protein ACJW31_03G087300 [Castanea mollissima]
MTFFHDILKIFSRTAPFNNKKKFHFQHTKCSSTKVLYNRQFIRIKILRPFLKRKFQIKHTKIYIYDLHNWAPSPSKALYIQLGMENFIAVCTRILIMLN